MEVFPEIVHHGGKDGVTGSCHELRVDDENGLLVDCGLFQGEDAERLSGSQEASSLEIDFTLTHIKALVVTHAHIDHVGRIPYLLAAGFAGPIYCSEPTALLLPLMLEDAIKIGFTRDQRLIEKFVALLEQRLVALPYGQWREVPLSGSARLDIKLRRAGHILGSAYVECRVKSACGDASRVLFSGDLGAPFAPLLPAPKSPYGADVVVLESTYGDRVHADRRSRRSRLQTLLEHALVDRGVVLVPAFSIGRTQELLYEIEGIIHRQGRREAAPGVPWADLEIIVDSPLASRFTEAYRRLKPFWDAEAQQRLRAGRHPLAFEQLTTIDSHADHLHTVDYLHRTRRPCVVIAGSGMCAGGRIVNYLKALLAEPATDVLFVGYQAAGTPGRAIQQYGPRGGYVTLDGKRYDIRAQVHTLSGYSAHADQRNLLNFIKRMRRRPKLVHLVHGEAQAKAALRGELEALGVAVRV
ncbi:metallo-beta-lactamase family protein [Geoalkalibacter ferrihydriticus]|uniref:Metallo-beta-lactamase family protein n=1 Tax=Geoalkalibacter ferrihydriticus TaxID=392333 RepID=A0A1G9X8M7_9BACT|nr:MBL fold metallo-hydrolase [Geoalkalibacter ferrihydriticus]SDM92675.1 metallo-beta-lactamase family protein [Geoalkalibacter ferrihydriticus]